MSVASGTDHPLEPPPANELARDAGGTDENAVIARRRKYLYDDGGRPDTTWGLALSGGGIRSATFCLGMLQALAQAKFAHSGERAKDPSTPLLARFDYLSTVSGGGYVGAFFSGLFRPRLRDLLTDKPVAIEPVQAAKDAYAALQRDPPGRLGAATLADPVELPLRWLRENGRYLAPNGAGDLLYDIAIALRNLCGVHYVAAITLLTLFLLAFVFRYLTVELIGTFPVDIELLVQPADPSSIEAIWPSPWFVVAAGWFALVVMPLGVAYWYRLDYPPKNAFSPANPWVASALVVVLALAALFITGDTPAMDVILHPLEHGKPALLALFAAIAALSIVFFLVADAPAAAAARIFRARINHWLAGSLGIGLLISAYALIETGGQTLYLWLLNSPHTAPTVSGLAGGIAAVIALVRGFAPALAQPRKDGLLAKIPLDFILGAVGVVLLLVLLICWHAFATYLFMGGGPLPQGPAAVLIDAAQFRLLDDYRPWVFLSVCIGATFAAGYSLGFVNLSSLQMMYSARLTRAYLGASNRTRFTDQDRRLIRVTEPDADDDLDRDAYFDRANLGPAHIINVTINATTGSGDALTRRDRQGLPMAITPDGITVEGTRWTKRRTAELKISQWIGISGAAFSTGIGRGTSLGKALLLSMTNVRLGWWWRSGLDDKKAIQPLWRNQTYLLRELRARFMGKDGSHWYLSDGGHFENTAVFELLRRKVDVAVCCDCGADPDYQFADLANLMRLARIDFQAEFTPITPLETPLLSARAAALSPYFALTAADLAGKAGGDNKCALLYRVSYQGSSRQTLLVVIKPRLLAEAPLDLVQYHAANPAFPQQPTSDQFFDDAQWESYRKLGALIGSRLFPA